MATSVVTPVADAPFYRAVRDEVEVFRAAARRGLPVLLVSGAADPVMPAAEAAKLAAALGAAGASTAHETVPAGHGPDPRDVALARRFLAGLPAPG